jgi:hypothetical protein
MTKGIQIGRQMGKGTSTGEADAAEFPTGKVITTVLVCGVGLSVIKLAEKGIARKMGEKSFPDFDIEVSVDPKKGFGKLKARDAETTAAERAEIKAAKESVRDAKKALKDAKKGDEKKDARKDLKKAEQKLAELIDPDHFDEVDDKDDEDDEEAAA